MPFWADFSIVSGSGSECRTIAPYSPYSAMIVDFPQVFSVLRHLALLFWNHTCMHRGMHGFEGMNIIDWHVHIPVTVANEQSKKNIVGAR